MRRDALPLLAGASLLAALAFVPRLASDYGVSLGINLLMYANLATAWGVFCGATRLVSLATAAFFGVGCYVTATLGEQLPWPLLLAVAAALGGALALAIGLCTLRLSGAYFVIFSFGVAELIRQLVTWYESKVAGSVGRYVFADTSGAQIYWSLLALLALLCAAGAWLSRSRLGFALRLVGEDEEAARSCGVNTVAAKLAVLTGSAAAMAVVGAIVAPRWTYIDPSIAFNPIVSFQVVVMALLGGLSHFAGAMLGVVPLTMAFELLGKHLPNASSIALGAIFLSIVYVLPGGLLALAGRWRGLRRARRPA